MLFGNHRAGSLTLSQTHTPLYHGKHEQVIIQKQQELCPPLKLLHSSHVQENYQVKEKSTTTCVCVCE